MKKSPFTEEQIAWALHQHESGISVAEVVRRRGVSKQTFYRCVLPPLNLIRFWV